MEDRNHAMRLEAVYYSAPVPRSKASLTALALVFDRVHFPNVYLPDEGVDLAEVTKEADRIAALSKDFDSALAVGALRALGHLPHLREFCEFTGTNGQIFGGELKRAGELRARLENALFGSVRPGVIRSIQTGFHKGLPGGGYIDFPDPLNYSANAVLYAADKGLPLVNDSNLPVLPVDQKNISPGLLASIIALKCVELALPIMPPMTPAAISEMRNELSPQLAAFRSSVARMAVMLQVMLGADATGEDIQRAAAGLVHTDVSATLSDLDASLKRNKAFSVENVLAAGGVGVALLGSADSLPLTLATALTGLGLLGFKIKKDYDEPRRSGMYYLLKAKKFTGR